MRGITLGTALAMALALGFWGCDSDDNDGGASPCQEEGE